MGLEKYALLERLTQKLVARGCAVGWNPTSATWDLKVRRGALGEARLRMVVEHHGGPRRLARLAATIRPPSTVYWAQGIVAALALTLGALGLQLPLGAVCAFLTVLWITPIREANRLEAAIQSAAAAVAQDLGRNESGEAASG